MRYPASEKLEIIRIVEQSQLPVRRRLEKLGILPGPFYRWCDQSGGVEAVKDRPSRPTRASNRIPDDVRLQIIETALGEPKLSPRELATRFTDTQSYFVPEAYLLREDDRAHILEIDPKTGASRPFGTGIAPMQRHSHSATALDARAKKRQSAYASGPQRRNTFFPDAPPFDGF